MRTGISSVPSYVLGAPSDRRPPAGMPKITMPSTCSSLPRRQLFARLDEFEPFALIWISAPAGYGKTTVIADYLRERRRPAAWYQCDEGDADIASFFHYVALARSGLSALEPPPAFLSQYLSAVPVFCRNFFRQWFAGLPQRATLVLDNWEDVPTDAELRSLLPIIVEQLPRGQQIIVISRTEPDSGVSRLILHERVAQLQTADLQLSRVETEELARARSRDASVPWPVDVERLYRLTQGWAAAVTLLLSQHDSAPTASQEVPPGASQTIFDYLATEAFEHLPAPARKFLLEVACLDHISVPVARRISGCADAGSMLDTLARENVFTSFRAVSSSYHLHPLFRGFLQRRQSLTLPPQAQRDLLQKAARALSSEGDVEAGLHLLLQAQIWHEAAEVIREIAPRFVDQARLATLSRSIEALPNDLVETDAWLLYWRGVCRFILAFESARDDLERSYAGFVSVNDRAGQSLACAAILQHIAYSYLDYRDLLPWIARLEPLLENGAPFDSSRTEIKVRAAFMLALSQGVPNHPKLVDSVAHVCRLVQAERDIVNLAEGVSALLHFFSRFGRTSQYGDLDNTVARLLADATLPPIHRLNLLWLHAYQLHSSGDPTRVVAILGEARALARHEGLYSEDTRMRLCELQAQEIGASSATALATFSELEPHIRGMPAIPRAHFLYVRSIFELGCGNLVQALKYSEEALPLIRASHWYIGEALALTGLAEVYCSVGRHEDAARCIRECVGITEGVVAPLVEFNLQLVCAELARIRGSSDFREALAKAFAIGRQQGYANGFHTSSQLLRRLIPYGLELDIEPSYCSWVIGKRRFKPPSPLCGRWPWPVKIRAFGRFRIYVNGEELIVRASGQRKPMEILKLLSAHPDGMEMSRIMDELWPDLDGDAARNALDVTVHRLRKILKNKEAVEISNGTLALSKDRVWLDTEAFDHVASRQSALPGSAELHEEVLELYRGGLLGEEEVRGTLLAARDRFRMRFVGWVSQSAKDLESAGRWDDVASLYSRAIERAPVEESLHRGLIRALEKMGRDTRSASKRLEGMTGAYRRFSGRTRVNAGTNAGARRVERC